MSKRMDQTIHRGSWDGQKIDLLSIKPIVFGLCIFILGFQLSACLPERPSCTVDELVAPELVEPADGSLVRGERSTHVPHEAYEIQFAWRYPTGTCSPGAFQVDISDNPDFIPSPSWGFVTLDQRETSRTWQLPPGCYYWRVAAYSRLDDRNGPYSPARQLCLEPSAATLMPTSVPASISGWVYIDGNVNDMRDAGEGSISGAMLTLKTGACPGGAGILTVESDPSGRYSISPVDPGDYCLATSPIQQTLDPTERSVSVAPGEALDDLNFRYLTGYTAIAGWVYIDENVNDVRDPGEGSISGALLTLKAGSCPGGADVITVESDVTGRYFINPVEPGEYCLATSPVQQTLYPESQSVSVASGELVDDVNFRYLLEPLETATPVPTATLPAAMATLLDNANCRLGPDIRYEIYTTLLKGQTALVKGRDPDDTWWWILVPNSQAHCWVSGQMVEISGDITELRVIVPLPLPTVSPTPVQGCWVYNQQKQKVCAVPCPYPNPGPGDVCTP